MDNKEKTAQMAAMARVVFIKAFIGDKKKGLKMKINFKMNDFLQSPLTLPPAELVEEWRGWVVGKLQEMCYDSRDALSFNKLVDYAARYGAGSDGEFAAPPRGIVMMGSRGTGKTEFLRRFSAMFDVDIIDARDLAWEFAIGGATAVNELLMPRRFQDLIIDDIGNEDEAKNWGNSFSLAAIIDKRYRLWSVPGGPLTFFATNATPEELAKRYGNTVASRIFGMCDVIRFSGTDRRLER